ncbi:HAUS augmin-like complex subunit 3 [Marchantia polymorpha subsp. ruderalis]|uniref:HAUS augmin-like complex subunit 3 N-terminal domain-containing protein n=2 Tax=Marchantia polymorpha TaxID=3197 RepID=A0AAF6B5A2_MARPO|nr:hypothetical protein MARPO_0098s0023 [Marchantia polymorpha]BBN07186.1 hypothetical protein Mp_4g01770 [Marchantia polymorpha subsp. ruderalis]|eukprot:PTQ32473.1 hypothetical protein MARPO_0098s0023 [Marchantia polymorpha]
MSGARLCSLLTELGYDGWQSLDPDSFEWPFQYEETRPVLDWLCVNLRPSNVLSTPEIIQYNALLEEGKVLEGEDLDFAYESISAFARRRSNQEAVLGVEESVMEIKEATVAYKAEAQELQKRLQHLQVHLDSLSGHTSSVIQGRRARASSSSTTSEQLLMSEEKLAARNVELNAVLEKISSSARDLAYYHSGEEEGIYLSFADFRSFIAQDQACTKALNDWFVKQFDVGPSRLVAEEGQSKCSWGGLEDENQSSKGDSEKMYNSRVSELQRLRSIFGVSERQWVEAQVENAKQQASLQMAMSQASADQHHIHSDITSLRRKHTEVGNEIYTLSKSEEKLLNEVIPSLCWELAQLQDTYILQGDYDLKVMRQEYYISQQKKFIGLLADQLARHRFLQFACQLERKQMNGAYELLRLIDTDLQGFSHATIGRIERYTALANAAAETNEQGAVDDQDTFLHRVRDILNIHACNGSIADEQGGSRMYVSALGLVQQISQLHDEKQALQAEMSFSLPEDKNKCLNDLCDIIRQMQQLLFASSTTAQPVLSPWPLMKELAEMEKVNSQLSAAIEEVTREHREKAEIVKHHPHEVGRERQVFVDFFTNPDRLRSLVRDLTVRVKALQS